MSKSSRRFARTVLNDVMLDIETTATSSNAAILSIAAVKFCRNWTKTPDLSEMDTFYRRITLSSCREADLKVDARTVTWWKQQDPKVYEEAWGDSEENPRVSLNSAMTDLKRWFGDTRYVWGHGASFDPVIVENAMGVCNISPPWKFWNIRDTRTLYDLGGVRMADLPKEGLHNPLMDCWRQIHGVRMSMQKLSLV